MSSILGVLKNKYFRNLWFGQMTSLIAVNMMGFILMIRVYQLTSSNTAVSGIILSIGLPAIIFGILAGGLVDHFEKKDILVLCNILRAIVFILFFWSSNSLPMAYLLAFVFSSVSQFFIPAEAATIPSIVSSDNLLSANSLFTFSLYVSTIIGFVAAGPLLRLFGPHNIFLFLSAMMILASFFVFSIPKEKIKRRSSFSFLKVFDDINEGFSFIKKNMRIQHSLLLVTFAQALIAILAALAPGFADKTLKIVLEDSSYLVMGPAALGLILGALAIGTWGNNFLKRFIIIIGVLGTGVTLVLLSLLVRISHGAYFKLGLFNLPIGGLEIAMLFIFILGMTNALISVPANTILQEDTAGNLRGRIYGVVTSLTGGAAILPVLFSGIMADSFGIGKTLFIIGIMVLVFGLYRLVKLSTMSFNF